MGIIINGVLKQELNWGLVLIGAMLAIGLELCAVSSLAFAVGVYIPMQYTLPIFLGGILRWIVDWATRKPAIGKSGNADDEAQAIAESETGPGLLLASGYIAGGTLAGVVIAFLELPFFSAAKVDLSRAAPTGDTRLPFVERDLVPALVFLAIMLLLALVGAGKMFRSNDDKE
jgi:uncharacterized oligopeptide transporter (OPT) family protein